MRVPYEKAISFIRDHGHFAAMTLDGVLAQSTSVMDRPTCSIHDACWMADGTLVRFVDDIYFEETTVFDVDDHGMVDVNAVRIWLGY